MKKKTYLAQNNNLIRFEWALARDRKEMRNALPSPFLKLIWFLIGP